jgi:hypothetical protein
MPGHIGREGAWSACVCVRVRACVMGVAVMAPRVLVSSFWRFRPRVLLRARYTCMAIGDKMSRSKLGISLPTEDVRDVMAFREVQQYLGLRDGGRRRGEYTTERSEKYRKDRDRGLQDGPRLQKTRAQINWAGDDERAQDKRTVMMQPVMPSPSL